MNSSNTSLQRDHPRPRGLTVEQIEQINEALASLKGYGEIHLIIQHGELKYINKLESHRAWDDDERKSA